MGLLLQIPANSNISHGLQLQCRNLINEHSPWLRAMLMDQMLRQCAIVRFSSGLTNTHSIADPVPGAFPLSQHFYKEVNCDLSGLSTFLQLTEYWRVSIWASSLLIWIQCSFHSLCLTALRLGVGEAQAWGQLRAAAWPNGQFQFQALYNCSLSVNFPAHSLPLWLTQSKRLLVQTMGKAAQVQQPKCRKCARRWKNIFLQNGNWFLHSSPMGTLYII